jgi:hypothetical protein
MRTLRDLVCELSGAPPEGAGEPSFWARLGAWPPDAFALTSAILEDSGAYRLCVSPPSCAWPPCTYREVWLDEIARDAADWRAALDADGPPPPGVPLAIEHLEAALDRPVRALGRARDLEADGVLRRAALATFRLHALADEACAGVGEDAGRESLVFEYRAAVRLYAAGTLSTFDTDRVRVLPKLRTPGAGLTLRSLSLHLAAQRSELEVTVASFPGRRKGLVASGEHRLNLLLAPWPTEIQARDFAPTQAMWRERPADYLSFAFAPPERPEAVTAFVESAVAASRDRGVDVHGVVLPEAAVTLREYGALRDALEALGVGLLLAGTRDQRRNEARLSVRHRGWHTYVQPKHHRWCLEGEQIHQYHLGAALHPSRRYWEDIEVPERQLRFVRIGDWLTLCHLVCEDLARLDPVSAVIRAAGPNLVIALLLDGPQLEARWPGRYASVLADDPGSSVLTLTSLGMVRRCLPRGRPPSRVVALWKDPARGVQELALAPGAQALVVSLCGVRDTEWTADGRAGRGVASQLVLAAVEQLGW